MTIKQMIFSAMIFVSLKNCATIMPTEAPSINQDVPVEKDFVFYKGILTNIEGNDLWSYLNFERLQANPTPVFKDIKVVEFTKNNNFEEIGTLGLLEKANHGGFGESVAIRSMANSRGVTKRHKAPSSPVIVARVEKHIAMNNAIYCGSVEQVADYDGNLHYVGAIIYRTQKLERCAFYREYLAQQKLATKK
jgi:hypothetical protein